MGREAGARGHRDRGKSNILLNLLLDSFVPIHARGRASVIPINAVVHFVRRSRRFECQRTELGKWDAMRMWAATLLCFISVLVSMQCAQCTLQTAHSLPPPPPVCLLALAASRWFIVNFCVVCVDSISGFPGSADI